MVNFVDVANGDIFKGSIKISKYSGYNSRVC